MAEAMACLASCSRAEKASAFASAASCPSQSTQITDMPVLALSA